MAQVLKPSKETQITQYAVSIFLAGSIEMDLAEKWQEKVEAALSDMKVSIFNPRRDDWDSSWEQDQANLEFNNQVNWELNHLASASIIFMYFDPNTKSPISLLELGKFASGHGSMIVCCPDGFWRKGNVDIFCTREGVPVFNTLDEAIGALITKINQINY